MTGDNVRGAHARWVTIRECEVSQMPFAWALNRTIKRENSP